MRLIRLEDQTVRLEGGQHPVTGDVVVMVDGIPVVSCRSERLWSTYKAYTQQMPCNQCGRTHLHVLGVFGVN